MTAHLVGDENVVHTTEQSSGKVHTNNGHPVVGTLQEVVGMLAAIEAIDTAAFAGLAGLIGALAATEAADTTAIAGLVGRTGTLAATEGADAAVFAGTVSAPAITGALAAIEAADVAALAGAVGLIGTLATTDQADVFAAAGIVASAGDIVGSLDAAEGADTAAFVGVVPVPVSVVVGGGGYYPPERPLPVEGAGYGILPRLSGEAHGVVVATSEAAALLRGLVGEAAGSSAARPINLVGTASGQHDLVEDDEAAAIVWMLAA
jgi:hypothetical protein